MPNSDKDFIKRSYKLYSSKLDDLALLEREFLRLESIGDNGKEYVIRLIVKIKRELKDMRLDLAMLKLGIRSLKCLKKD